MLDSVRDKPFECIPDIQQAEHKQTHFNTSEKCKYSLSGSEKAISSSLSASSTDEASLVHIEKHSYTSLKKVLFQMSIFLVSDYMVKQGNNLLANSCK